MSFRPDVPGAEVVASPRYGTGRLTNWPVTGVVQHYTASLAEQGLVKWMAASSANSAHVFIYRNGHVVQMVRFGDRAYHAGEKDIHGFWSGKPQPTNVNNFSIGIENCNAGWLLKQGKDFFLPVPSGSTFVTGTKYKGPAPQQAPDHKGVVRWWEPYSDKLVEANIAVLKRIVDMFPAVVRANVQFHSDVSPHRKHDPGPLWPHAYVLGEVYGEQVIPAPLAAATQPTNSPDEIASLAAKRGDNNQDGENPEWHYDHENQMSLADRLGLNDDDMCIE